VPAPTDPQEENHNPLTQLAIRILTNHFEEFTITLRQNHPAPQYREEQLKEALEEILKLNQTGGAAGISRKGFSPYRA